MAVTTLPDTRAEPTPDDILASRTRPLPVVLLAAAAAALDRRSAPRLALFFLGAVLARGRRTVTSWIRAAKLGGQYQSCYLAAVAAGKRADHIAWRLFVAVVRPLLARIFHPSMTER